MVDRSLTLGTLFSANVADFVRKVDLIKRKVGQMNATMASVGRQTRGLDKATGSIDKMGKSMDKTGRRSKTLTTNLGAMGKALSSVGAAAKISAAFLVASFGIQALTRGLAAGTKEIIDFDQALKNLQAITKSTDAEVVGMGEVIKKVATETKFSTGEVAEGMVLLGQAGFSVTEAMQSMASVANLATGTLSDMRMTSDLLTTTIRAFNLSTVESARVADVMANAINRSKLTIDKLRIAFNFVGAASAQAGLSLEETAGSMMLLANNGLRASTIGTGLRQVMSRLLAPNRKLREEFKEQGIALDRVNPATQGWSNALENLIPVIINVETGMVNMAKAYQLFGLRGAQAVAILAKGVASGDYQKMIEFTMEVGSAARMAGTQMEGLGVKIKNLADRMKLIAVALGEAGLTTAFKVLIDTLRATALVITNFINTSFGQMVTAFAGWTFVIWGTIKALSVLIKIVGIAGGAIAGRFTAALLAAGGAAGAASAGFSSLSLVLIKTIGRFLKASSIQRQINSLEKFDTKTQTVIQTLGLYASKLEELVKKKKDDEDVTKAHSKTIERFQQAIEELEKNYGELDIALKDNTESLEDNLTAIENLKKAELEKSVKTNIEMIKKYSDQIERTNFWSALFNKTTSDAMWVVNSFTNSLKELGRVFVDMLLQPIRWAIQDIKAFANVFGGNLGPAFDWVGEKADQFWEFMGKKVDEFTSNYSTKTQKVIELSEAQRTSFVRAAQGLDLLGRGTRSIESIIEELETLSGKKIDIKGIEAINDALKKIEFTLDEQKKKWNETFNDLPTVFKDMYDKLNLAGKVDFNEFIKRLAAKEARMEKTARNMGMKESEIYAGLALVRVKEFQDFAELQDKKVKLTKDTVDKTLDFIDFLTEKTKEASEKRYENAKAFFLREYNETTKNKGQLLKVEETFLKEVDTITEERSLTLAALAKRKKDILISFEQQTVREITKLNKKMYKDLQDQLRKRLEGAKKDLETLQSDLLNMQKTHAERLRELKRLTLTDEEKWLDTQKEANRLYQEALRTGNKETFEKAAEEAAKLGRKVEDIEGKTIKTIAEGQQAAIDLVSAIQRSALVSFKAVVNAKVAEVRELEGSLGKMTQKLKDLQTGVEKLNATELALDMEESLRDMEGMHNITSKFKDDWDALHSKTITLTVKYKYVGGPPSTSDASGGIETHPTESEAEGQRWGGVIRRKIGGYIRKAFGGKLAGYGGGDKVKILAEPGEYVVRKEAVKKYGEGVFSALNSMKVSSANMGEAVAQKIGGIIKKVTQVAPTQKFAMGGGVSLGTTGAAPKVINIYLQPKYMTGDRQAMRAVATEISRALDEQNKRWGGR